MLRALKERDAVHAAGLESYVCTTGVTERSHGSFKIVVCLNSETGRNCKATMGVVSVLPYELLHGSPLHRKDKNKDSDYRPLNRSGPRPHNRDEFDQTLARLDDCQLETHYKSDASSRNSVESVIDGKPLIAQLGEKWGWRK